MKQLRIYRYGKRCFILDEQNKRCVEFADNFFSTVNAVFRIMTRKR